MKIHKLEFKNFASYGNRIQVIEFEKNKSNLYQVLGSNGSGKSSLAKAITYMCYGRVDGTNLKDLANRVNGSLWGKIYLESKGTFITIERGISPNIFNVWVNDVPYDVAGKSNLQDFLETEMYEIPFHVFKNLIILSVNDFKSFISMSPYDKKQIIDRIFGFSVINQMREHVKSSRRLLINEIKTLDDEIRTLEESIQSVNLKIVEYERLAKKSDEDKLKKLKKSLLELNETRKKIKDANDKIKIKLNTQRNEHSIKTKRESELIFKKNELKKGLALYDNNECPTCKSPLDSSFHKHIKNEKLLSLEEVSLNLINIKNEILESENLLAKIKENETQIHTKLIHLETKMKSLKEETLKLTESTDDDSFKFKELIQEFKNKKKNKYDERLKIEGDDSYFSILENILGEDGIKNLAIKSILPSFNLNIQFMSKEMGIPFNIKFDDKFDCSIKHLGQEISPKTLSTGERKKVDFVIIMALIKMIKVKFSGINILFLDEIFSSVDAEGVHHIITILHKTIRDIGINTFVINHTVLPSEYFDKKLEITKAGGFSEFKIESIK